MDLSGNPLAAAAATVLHSHSVIPPVASPGGRWSRPGRSAAARGSRAKKPIRNLTTERKYVSILRADLHRSSDLVVDLPLEQSLARLGPALDQMREAVHQHGGIIHRELGDGLFAVFGAPVADDLHAVMACVAALDLLRRIRSLGDPAIRVRIGVHSGLVIAGPRQVDYISSYEFDGPPLIMAERLQAAAAPGQALASEACRSLAAGYIEFGPSERISLKSFVEPVIVHEVKDIGELSRWRVNLARGITAFVGRQAEFTRLLALAETTKLDIAGVTVVVSGEPGVGKSRLVHECQSVLRASGWQVIATDCNSIVGHSPFSLLKGILAGLMQGLESAEIASIRSGLLPAQAAALESLLDGAEPTSPAWAGLTPRARGRAIAESAGALMQRRVGERPTLLMIDDLQWADEASAPALEAIANLANRLPLVILVTARTGGVPAWLKRKTFIELPLAALNADDGLAMLDNLLGPSPRLATMKARILSHTGALPLFLEELCRSLAEAGKLIGTPGKFEPISEAAELDVPLTVQGVIASRIDRLSPTEKRLLQEAAAIGAQISNRLLRAISVLEDIPFQKSMVALWAAGLLVSAPEPVQAANTFAHEFIRQVAYDAVPAPDKVSLHKRILAELEAEAKAGQTRPGHGASLVHHALQAREWARSAEHAAAIARQCVTQAALPDAARYFETALDALDKCEASDDRERRAIDLRIEARSAYANSGKVTRWLSMANEAEARARSLGDGRRHTAAAAVRAAALNFCGTPTEALKAGQEAVQEAVRIADDGWLAYAEYGLGQACFVAGRYGEAVATLNQAYRRFNSGAKPPAGGNATFAALLCLVMTSISQAAMGEYAAAEQVQRQADAMASKDGGALAAIASGFSSGTLLLHRDEVAAAEAVLASALARARQHEINLFVPVIACQHGLALLLLRRADEARQTLATALKEAEDQAHRSAGLRAEIYSTLCLVEDTYSCRRALDTIQVSCATASQQGYDPIRIEALLAESALLCSSLIGEPIEAERCEREARVIAARLGAAGTLSHLRRSLARIFGSTVLTERST
jgi:class 3 adenylate cyclase/tetratricopeptide (TPR) repeat protein